MIFKLRKNDRNLTGQVHLDGSKSISNRALIIRALSGQDFPIHNLSSCDDTVTMEQLLTSSDSIFDVGPAGTTFRFLTAYLALQPGSQVLTGSDRMKQRPIGPLVTALRRLGAEIQYLDKEGYPPLKINSPQLQNQALELSIPANISSQFISALLMIAPVLPRGLIVHLEGELVSASYLKMTLAVMSHFGIDAVYEGQSIKIAPQTYQGATYTVESDWSAASYHFALAALAEEVDYTLTGLFSESLQGDSITPVLFQSLGITSQWQDGKLHLTNGADAKTAFEHDYLLCPDIAQTMAVVLGARGISGLFSGLQTLSIKETDRIAALRTELAKVQVSFAKMPARFSSKSEQEYYMIEGKAVWTETPTFATYHDHRMAMAFAPLAMIQAVQIEDPEVVTKSYPDFWKHLTDVGFTIELVSE